MLVLFASTVGMTIEERIDRMERQLNSLNSKIDTLLQIRHTLSPLREYLSKNEVAEKLGVSVTTLDRWMEARQIPYIKIGGTIRFKSAHLENFLDKHERKAIKVIA